MTSFARTDTGNGDETDTKLKAWRQGDIALAGMVYHFSHEPGESPVSVVIEPGLTGQPIIACGEEVVGLVVLSQTCDVVRSHIERPLVEVCPVKEVDSETFAHAQEGATPQFAYVPGLKSNHVADLGRVMSIHKVVLVSLDRQSGWVNDDEIRRFQATIARRYQRFAFPDDLHKSFGRLTQKLKHKHGKERSAEGMLFARVAQIRVRAEPNWQNDEIHIELSYILPNQELDPISDDQLNEKLLAKTNKWLGEKNRDASAVATRLIAETDPSCASLLWEVLVQRWTSLAEPIGVIKSISGVVAREDEYKICDYWRSERLDLDYLSDYELQD